MITLDRISSFPLQERSTRIILFVTWLTFQVIFLLDSGIVTAFEAPKYIEQAQNLLQQGKYTSTNFLFYSVEILLIATALKLNTGFFLVVLVHLLLNAVSVLLFYKLVLRFTASRPVALLFALAFLFMGFYHVYNVKLFTESLYFSFSIIFCYYLFTLRRLSFLAALTALAGLILLIFTRPTGLLFIPPALFFLIAKFGGKKTMLLFSITVVAGLTAFYFILNFALGSGGEFDFLLPYEQEHIICGVPTFLPGHHLTAPENKNTIAGLWFVISNNPGLFLSLAVKRFFSFWGGVRSYYSFLHNAFLAFYFYSLYLILIRGVRRFFSLYSPEGIFLLTYILLINTTVLLSCDDWHNRFLFSILPFILLLAGGIFLKKSGSH